MSLMMELIPMSKQSQAAAAELLKVGYLDMLYNLDKRDKPDHPLCGRYTGLYQKYGPACTPDECPG